MITRIIYQRTTETGAGPSNIKGSVLLYVKGIYQEKILQYLTLKKVKWGTNICMK